LRLTDQASPEACNLYFAKIAARIDRENIQEISFTETNHLFRTDDDLGVYVFDHHKKHTGFNYRLKLPHFVDTKIVEGN
jgi:hypothetical protein